MRAAAALYPPAWRERYAAELDALLDDVNPNWHDVVDLVKGALVMQLKHRGAILAGFAVVGALAGGAVALEMPERYMSSAIVVPGPDPRLFLERTLPLWSNDDRKAMVYLVDVSHSGSTTLSVGFADRDGTKARQTTQDLIARIVQAGGSSGGTIATARSGPNRPAVAIGGEALALLLGGIAIWLRDRRAVPSSKC